jgi:hypothetical protein
MSDSEIIQILSVGVIGLAVVAIILAIIALWLVKQLDRTRRALRKLQTQVELNGFGRRIKERL